MRLPDRVLPPGLLLGNYFVPANRRRRSAARARARNVRDARIDAGRCDVEHANKRARVQDGFEALHDSEESQRAGRRGFGSIQRDKLFIEPRTRPLPDAIFAL